MAAIVTMLAWCDSASGDTSTITTERTTIKVACQTTCVAVGPVPTIGLVNIEVLHGELSSTDASVIRLTDCGNGRRCASNVSTETLRLLGIIEAADASAADSDPFEDAVLVGGRAGYRCSGVAIDATHVLTAAHCAPATHVGIGTRADSARAILVIHSELHPTADAAVLTLADPLPVTVHPRRSAREDPPPLGRLRVLGFGVRDTLRFTGFGVRHELDLTVDGWGCPSLLAVGLGCRPGVELYLHDGGGNDTCFGDSGGPVFEATTTGWRLIAITSRGAEPRKHLCGEGGIYVRVDYLASWLRQITTL